MSKRNVKSAGVHVDGKWKNAKEVDIVIKQNAQPNAAGMRKPKIKAALQKKKKPKGTRKLRKNTTNLGGSMLNMIECKECMNPLTTSEQYLTSLFNPDKGTCRGMAFGSENTSLTDYRIPFEITVPAGYGAVVYLNPLLALTTYGIIYSGTGVPFNSTTNINLTNTTNYSPSTVSGPFVATSASKIRITGYEVNVIADSTVLSKGGWQQVCYVDNMYDGFPTFQAGGATAYFGPGTYGALDNYPMTRKYNGDEDLILHWFPNGDEIYLQDLGEIDNASPLGPSVSGFIWLAQAPSANAVTYNFDIRVVLEYVPTDSVRVLSKKVLPVVHPLAQYYMNMLVATRWPLIVMSEATLWQEAIKGITKPPRDPLQMRQHFAITNMGISRQFESAFLESG
jgi:hypothetical protein